MEWTRGRILGRGSTATVYAATRRDSNEILAVKSSELHRSEFLQREAKILSSLSSPYVIGYRGSETRREPNGVVTYNLLMERAPYGTLADAAAKNGGRLEEAAIAKYTREMLRGLEYVHSRGVAHCDVKGSNVVVGEKGEAKLVDFGCSKRVEVESGAVVGTPAFMAPEVARGERQGRESDIWAVGCTVIEMATGSPPWTEGSPVSVLYRVGYSGEAPELPELLTEEAKDFLEKCLKREPKERWTATQLLNHPFLITKPKAEPVSGLVSCSPTSVTDQTFWRSVEEEAEEEGETEELQEDTRYLDRLNLWACHSERIGRLRCVGGLDGSRLDMEGGGWITVRVSCEGTMIGGSHEEYLLGGIVN
ncbi:mitogen-activated protein kinase kinase kinase 17 [Raphanus sativus]|uniref:mitogen-activated protein kinase kinase kinase n=1 Tax=Raphanus sativus TaxID=3726 RepID=A0A6J0JGT2_RAPSA|nr:mitogen-activated protein kinase kinase kinase 17 [Raphanus sativus]KAJ4891480.1 mitogen-activated protein kinase kinase kinase 17 [Raphanus sativus]